MKVTLNQNEIFTAIENYILETVRVGDNIRLDMDLAATRGTEGYTATVAFVDVTDEAANPKDDVVPTEEAKGLSIVQKIEDARAKAPRRSPAKLPDFRQGSTAGVPEKAPTTEKGEDKAETKSVDPTDEVTEHTAPVKVDPPVLENPEVEYQPEPATEAESDQPTTSQEEAPVVETVDTDPEPEVEATTGTPKRSLFADAAPAQTEEALAAEAAATEPAEEEEEDYTPTPETKGLETEDAGDPPVETEKPKTRSLFGDLTKPAKN